MACSGFGCATLHEPGGLNLEFTWAGNAILCPNQHEFADVDRGNQRAGHWRWHLAGIGREIECLWPQTRRASAAANG